MKKVFIILGSITLAMVAGLSVFGLWVIEKNTRDNNRKKTEKARLTKLERIAKIREEGTPIDDNGEPYPDLDKVTETVTKDEKK